MKPTSPGPHRVIEYKAHTDVIGPDGIAIAWFNTLLPEARANAEAWISGVKDSETLGRVRTLVREYSESRMNALKCLQGIVNILDEP